MPRVKRKRNEFTVTDIAIFLRTSRAKVIAILRKLGHLGEGELAYYRSYTYRQAKDVIAYQRSHKRHRVPKM